jgi:NDP-sugar pyrophosphorylase family protein
MIAVVLVGGQGTRLRSVVADRPKPLAPIRGRPFLDHLVAWLQAGGVGEIALAAGYRSDALAAWVEGHPARATLSLSVEAEPLGTGGAVRAVAETLGAERLLVLNGDSFVRCDLSDFLAFDRDRGGAFSLVAPRVADVARYGAIEAAADGRITGFREKGGAGPGIINGGIYAIDARLIQRLPAGPSSLERDGITQWLADGGYAFTGDFPFIDIGTPESFQLAQEWFPE